MAGVSAEKAREICRSITNMQGTEKVPVSDACSRVCAETVYASAPQPAFRRAKMDGFAIRTEDSGENAVLRVVGKTPAGSVFEGKLRQGEAVRIMTGAPMPEGTDAVAPFEDVAAEGDAIVLRRKYRPGESFSEPGMDVRENDALCRRGCLITPWETSALSCCGVETVTVYRVPKIGIICTGSELYAGEGELPFGRIRNSNGALFASLLAQNGCKTEYYGIVGDDAELISALMQKAAESCDAIVVTGGVSGGDYDLTPDAVLAAGGTLHIRGIDAKPGCGCAYGVIGGKPVICLSGSPGGAALNMTAVGFAVIDKMRGIEDENIRVTRAELSDSVRKADCTILVPGYLENINARTVFREIPHGLGRLTGKALCSCAAVISPGTGYEQKGTVVDVYKMTV